MIKLWMEKMSLLKDLNSSVTQTSEIMVGNAISGKFTVELLSIMIRKSKCIRHVALSFKRNLKWASM